MKNIKTVSQALKMVEEIAKMKLPNGASLKMDFDNIKDPNEIEAICKQENGTFCPADKDLNYAFGTVTLNNIQVTLRQAK